MAKRKFTGTVTIEHEVTIELDDDHFTPEEMASFRQTFYDFHDLEDHVRHLMQVAARFNDYFIEGYGYVMRNGQYQYGLKETELKVPIDIRASEIDVDVDFKEVSS